MEVAFCTERETKGKVKRKKTMTRVRHTAVKLVTVDEIYTFSMFFIAFQRIGCSSVVCLG